MRWGLWAGHRVRSDFGPCDSDCLTPDVGVHIILQGNAAGESPHTLLCPSTSGVGGRRGVGEVFLTRVLGNISDGGWGSGTFCDAKVAWPGWGGGLVDWGGVGVPCHPFLGKVSAESATTSLHRLRQLSVESPFQ